MKKNLRYYFNVLIFLLLFSFGIPMIGQSQQEIAITLNWDVYPGLLKTENSDAVYKYPHLENALVGAGVFEYQQKFKRTSLNADWKFELISYQTSEINPLTENFIQKFNIKITSEIEYSLKNNAEQGRPTAMLSLTPFVRVNGEIKKIEQVSFRQSVETKNHIKSHQFAENSVLRNGSGIWYKISVTKDGIYKIDYDFLKDIGVDVNNLSSNAINIFGNAFGKLPELNSVSRPDDLLKNDILMVDGGDGTFDKNDYLLFYGREPHRWDWKRPQDSSYFSRERNIYSNYTAYFININPNEYPARVQGAQTSNGAATHIVSSYDAYAIHEQDLVNIKKSGQRWYGELFDANLSQSFSLNIPNLDASAPARVRSYFASKNGSGSGTNFRVYYGSTVIGTGDLTIPEQADKGSWSRAGFYSGTGVFQPTNGSINLTVEFNRLAPDNFGHLDFIEINARSLMKYYNEMSFRDKNSVGVGQIAEFQMTNFPSDARIWEVTNPTQPKIVSVNTSGGTSNFRVESDSLRSFIAFDGGSNFSKPMFVERVNSQNLHALGKADYLIVTHSSLLAQANRLADLHRAQGLAVHVTTVDKIYNEFSGGTQDPTGIRFFAKMFYDRANGDISKMPKYLLLFGDGTYDPLDRISPNHNLVPVYETLNSEVYTKTIVSDDYFGFFDENESFGSSDLLDIAVGRLLASNLEDATILVNKIEHYMKNGSNFYANENLACGEDGYVSTFGDWRQHYTAIADDEEDGYFVKVDLEPITNGVAANHPEMNVKKIYIDAYKQITTAGGERYPDVNEEIVRNLESGSLITCYVGHGGPKGAAQERIFTPTEAEELTNIDKLTLFVSATCEFTPVDDKDDISIGEILALNKIGGAIALMTTSRAVFFSVNSVTTQAFFDEVFKREADGKPRTFGDIFVKAKNAVSGGNNKRSFMLLGDPALRIALPYHKAVLDSVNNVDLSVANDTIRALSSVSMSGHIEDQFGNKLNNFSGILQPTVYDKPSNRKTLVNDIESDLIEFQVQENKLFKGRATIKNGEFKFEFIVPKDIDYSYGEGKISLYASNKEGNIDGGGYSNAVIIGGIDTLGLNDNEGPLIELYLNDLDFVNGGITNETPILIVKLYDESGINTVGNGIGHDITMILDDKTSSAIVLNEFYEADLDTYKSGEVRYQMSKLEPGLHTLTLKAWDVNNNSSESVIEFEVIEKQDLSLAHVLNYPNPFTTHTEFMFEHNQSCSTLEAQVEIYTVTGRLVKTINQIVETRGFRAEGIEWNGRDEFGDQLARGVYVYRLSVTNPDGEKIQKMEKLYLLK